MSDRDDEKIGEERADHLIAEAKKLLYFAVEAHGPDILLPIFCKAAAGYLGLKAAGGVAVEGLETLRGGLEAARLDIAELLDYSSKKGVH